MRIYEYDKQFLHAKTAVVDGEWATVGSFNLDSLSFFFNYEANIVVTEKDVVETVGGQFLNDLVSAREINPRTWAQRPLIDKIREVCIVPIRGFL